MNIIKEYGRMEGFDIFSEITRQYLIDCYDVATNVGDDSTTKYHKAIKRTIKYVSTPDQWKEFLNAHE